MEMKNSGYRVSLSEAMERIGADEVQKLVDSGKVDIGTLSELDSKRKIRLNKLRNGTKNQRKKFRQSIK